MDPSIRRNFVVGLLAIHISLLTADGMDGALDTYTHRPPNFFARRSLSLCCPWCVCRVVSCRVVLSRWVDWLVGCVCVAADGVIKRTHVRVRGIALLRWLCTRLTH